MRSSAGIPDNTERIRTANDVPRMPPANVHVPQRPNMVVFCLGWYHPASALIQLLQSVA